MKKLLLSMLACGALATANAQEGSILLYGNAGFNSDKQAGATQSELDWHVNPGVGYQLNNNWTIGVNLNWAQTAQIDPLSTNEYHTNSYLMGLFARYSCSMMHSNIFFWYAQANGSYMGSYITHGGDPSTGKTHGYGVEVFPGIGAHLGKGWAINMSAGSLGFNTMKDNGADDSYKNIHADFGFLSLSNYNIGLSWNLGGSGHHMHGHHEPMDETRSMDTSDDDNGGKHKKHSDD